MLFFARVALAGLLTLPFGVAAQDAPRFFADPRNGCKLWIEYPQSTKAVRWDGACRNGLATGAGRFQFTDSDGQTRSGEAEFVDGKRNGRGFEVYSSGMRYEGVYRNGMLNGRGWVTMAGESAGERYDGEFRNDRFHGQGVYTWPDGRRLEVAFNDGLPDGPGKYRDQNGQVIQGVFPGRACFYVNGRLLTHFVIGGMTSACRQTLQ